jgi:hypothetical protein
VTKKWWQQACRSDSSISSMCGDGVEVTGAAMAGAGCGKCRQGDDTAVTARLLRQQHRQQKAVMKLRWQHACHSNSSNSSMCGDGVEVAGETMAQQQ